MFKAACATARNFTWPVIISRRSIGGECTAGIGTFMVVNKEGWIITAGHILQLLGKMTAEERNNRELEARIAAIENDHSLNRKDRRRKLAQAGHLASDALDKWSVWWGQDGVRLEPGTEVGIEAVDIAVARLAPLNCDAIAEYPVFKKSAKEFEPGASLCRIGFPFWDVKPEWNAATNAFNLTQNVPLPLFANEGVLARMSQMFLIDPAGNPLPSPLPFPLKSIETSNPGLLGQSGGPIFDQKGVVWGIQTSTVSYELDLNTEEKQYYNVGVGCHAETVIAKAKKRRKRSS
jgi:hypothetical protein